MTKEKPINVYWSPNMRTGWGSHQNQSFLFNKPISLFSDLVAHKEPIGEMNSITSCPAIKNKAKKTLLFKNTISCSFNYDFRDGKKEVTANEEHRLIPNVIRDATLNYGPNIEFGLGFTVFADEPLEAFFSAPYFHKPGYTKYGTPIPGQYDIGQWFRTFFFEVQMWNQHGEFILEEDEPLYYVEFNTDRPILVHMFNTSFMLAQYSQAAPAATHIFGLGQTLKQRYDRFKSVGMREKILTEIKNNLIDAEPIKL